MDYAKIIESFETNLNNSSCMGTRRDAVMFLAKKIGIDAANQIAEMFGLLNSYYTIED